MTSVPLCGKIVLSRIQSQIFPNMDNKSIKSAIVQARAICGTPNNPPIHPVNFSEPQIPPLYNRDNNIHLYMLL